MITGESLYYIQRSGFLLWSQEHLSIEQGFQFRGEFNHRVHREELRDCDTKAIADSFKR